MKKSKPKPAPQPEVETVEPAPAIVAAKTTTVEYSTAPVVEAAPEPTESDTVMVWDASSGQMKAMKRP